MGTPSSSVDFFLKLVEAFFLFFCPTSPTNQQSKCLPRHRARRLLPTPWRPSTRRSNKLRTTSTPPQKISPPPTPTSNPPTSKSKSLRLRCLRSKDAANWLRKISRDPKRDSESPQRSWKRPPRQPMSPREGAKCWKTEVFRMKRESCHLKPSLWRLR